MLRPETREALEGAATLVEIGRSSTAYWRLFCDLWSEGERFMIVEQDVVPTDEQLGRLEFCPYDWCVFPHWCGGSYAYGLGCVRFSAGLMRRHPDAMERIAQNDQLGVEPGYWPRMDSFVAMALSTAGARQHHHHPPVVHLHEYELPPTPWRKYLRQTRTTRDWPAQQGEK